MTDFTRGLDRRTFIFGAAALGAATLLRPTLAFAEPTSADKFAEADSVRARINEMQEQLTIAGENYYKALDEHEAAVQAVADAQARIDEANAQIAELQDKLSKRARSMYRSGQTTALDVILGATTFEEFATSWDLLNDINDNDAAMVQQTKDLRAEVEAAKQFGQDLGIIFQIRDDIFDYYDSAEIGKPTGNDMAEGKLTLPVIYAVNSGGDDAMRQLALKVKARTVSPDEIARLVAYTKEKGGIEYAEKRMWEFHSRAQAFLDNTVKDEAVKAALQAYLDYVIKRNK